MDVPDCLTDPSLFIILIASNFLPLQNKLQ